ncbi:Maf family protein [Seohaeicola zhoushanensis]|uniref:Nucleoside triphosphate pyrophosphatase n=1 Tax=Seohaeicola zhoushanensis TaxID=1569283 RepID=A0A8J3GU76_9RHOB|nr:Maf family nucleotide pyrophosphatase [Seohaeicola zhoushanensis]GHF35361.1 Maf-like protein [Seohaeicola zhoushanensis]
MAVPIILASGSETRADMLRRARVPFEIAIPRIDEEAVRRALEAEGAKPRDVADALAELKARRIAEKRPEAVVIGSDQVLDLNGEVLSKPETPEEAVIQLARMQGKRHMLLSAAVVIENGQVVWRHVGQVRIRMRDLTPAFIESYVNRNWESIRYSVGGYKIEEEGVRLFSSIEGDLFTILGMPLIELLNYFVLRGLTET